MKTVLVAGASGLVGTALIDVLKKNTYHVRVLSTSRSTDAEKKIFHWNPQQGAIDLQALEGVEVVINLSGAGLFDHRWTEAYKKKIMDSRTQSTSLLVDAVSKVQPPLALFLNASATGFYGADTGDAWMEEESPAGHDFLARVVKEWEQSLLQHTELKARKVCLRFGIVLSDQGGALTQLALPVRYGVGAPLGPGNQYISWIHMQDLCRMILFCMQQETIAGVYNAVAPEPVTNEQMVKGIAARLHKSLWAPHVPAWALRLILGSEKASMLLGGNRVRNTKISRAGFSFTYQTLAEALHGFFSSEK